MQAAPRETKWPACQPAGRLLQEATFGASYSPANRGDCASDAVNRSIVALHALSAAVSSPTASPSQRLSPELQFQRHRLEPIWLTL